MIIKILNNEVNVVNLTTLQKRNYFWVNYTLLMLSAIDVSVDGEMFRVSIRQEEFEKEQNFWLMNTEDYYL